MPDLVVHGLQIAPRRARGRVHALLDETAPLADAGDLLLQLLLGRGQRSTAGRRVRPLGLERRQLGLQRGEPRRLDQHGAAVLELRDGGVQVLDDEQLVQVVGHAMAS